MNPRKKLNAKRARRTHRVRAVIQGTALRPRLTVHRTNRFMYAQLIDDEAQKTLAAATSQPAPGVKAEKKTKADQAFAVGEMIGKKAGEKGITKAIFDRRSYRFHGRVKQLAEGAKKGGLQI
jgi:large subunit ribosomal protein L18